MMAHRPVYTDEVIGIIVAMAADGARLAEIAQAIGTTSKRLSPRLCQLGIGPHRLMPVQVRVSQSLFAQLREQAAKRDITTHQLATRLIVRVAEDNLFAAILDDSE